jgi:ATP-dependent DNA helicase RecG
MKYLNRRIGDFLRELHLTEGKGTGIPKIKRAMKNNGSAEPMFETDDARSYFLVVLPKKQPVKDDGLIIHYDFGKIHTGGQVTPQVTPLVKKLLGVIQGQMSRTEMMGTLNLKDKKSFVERYISPAIEQDLIELTIPDKPTSSKQQYRLTSKGKELLSKGGD